MRALPESREKRWELLLFPFKAYAFIFPCWIVFLQAAPLAVREELMRATSWLAAGYGLTIVVFLVAGVIQLFAHRKEVAITSFVYAVLMFVILLVLLPACALAK